MNAIWHCQLGGVHISCLGFGGVWWTNDVGLWFSPLWCYEAAL